MGKDRRTKQVTYKRARFHVETESLKALLSKALSAHSTIGKRRQALGPKDEPPIWRVIGQFQSDADFFFGVLVQYIPGSNPLFLVDDANAESLTVEQMAAPKTQDGKTREPLEGMLFFAVHQDHIVLMQGSALRTGHLESHLMWLLHDARVLAGDNTLALTDLPPLATRQKLAKQPIRELDIGGELLPTDALQAAAQLEDEEDEAITRTEVKSVEFQNAIGSDKITDFLRSFMKDDEAAKLPLDDLAGSNIEYTLKLRYKRSTTERGQKLMNTLGKAFRNASGVDTVLHLKGGGKVTAKELRLSGPVRIDTYNGVPSPSEVFEVLRKWLLEKVQSGDVLT